MHKNRDNRGLAILVIALTIGTMLLGWRMLELNTQNTAARIIHESPTPTTLAVVETTTTVPDDPAMTEAMPPSEGDTAEATTTTMATIKWVDYPSPNLMIIEEIGINVPTVVTGPELYNAKGKQNDPVKGTVDLWASTHPFASVESVFVEPCEFGLTFVTAHTLSDGGVGFNFVDYGYTEADTGISLESEVVFRSESDLRTITCTYEIVEWPSWVPFPQLGETPARYYPKDPAPQEVYIELVRQSMLPLLVLSTSYGGESGREYQDNGVHKYYNAVLLAELVDVKVEGAPIEGVPQADRN